MSEKTESHTYIQGLVERARKAQEIIEFAGQEEVDEMTLRLAWAAVKPDFARQLAETLVQESGMGLSDDKYAKIQTKVRGALRDMKGKKTVGVVERDEKNAIIKVAKPMGVIGALLPVTNGEATPLVKALFAIKTRNAIIFAPHPKGKKTNTLAVEKMREVLGRGGWPKDLIIAMEEISVEKSTELMRQSDIVLATGGGTMVKAAYASGTPSQGVGAGNAVSIIDNTANIADSADKIMRSKTFDYATSCSTENSLLIHESIYERMLEELRKVGGYTVSPDEKEKLKEAMWDQKSGALKREVVAKTAFHIADIAGITPPPETRFFLIEEHGVGKGYPFSQEKLSVIAAVYKWKEFPEAVDLVNRITAFSGPGHSCGIHSFDEKNITELALRARVSRIMVRQPQCLANSGAWTNGMPMSLTLGCGSWGGTSTTSNVTWEHLLNYTWVSSPIPSTQPSDLELFGTIINE